MLKEIVLTKKIGFIGYTCIILLFLIIPFHLFTTTSFGSKHIIREQVKDESFDLSNIKQIIPFGDLKLINYISDGKTLNATLWLHSPPVRNSEVRQDIRQLQYGILIDVDSDSSTGWESADYEYYIKMKRSNFNMSEIKWTETLVEHPISQLSKNIFSKLITFENTIESDNQYVFLSLNLKSIGSPNVYKILFYSNVVKGINNVIDFTNWFNVPTTGFSITTFPENIEVRQGEEQMISIKIESNTNIISKINSLKNLHHPANIDLIFPKDNTYHYKLGLDPTNIQIKVPNDAPIGKHNVPFQANISLVKSNSSFPAIVNLDNVIIPDTFSNTLENVNLNVTVLPKLSLPVLIKDFWETYGGILSFIGAGFTGGLASYLIEYFKSRKSIKPNGNTK